MNNPRLTPFAWYLPLAYSVHILEEYYAGAGFPKWFSSIFQVDLSETDFININTIGLSVMLIHAILYTLGKAKNLALVAFGTVLFVNGVIHLTASTITWGYSPGTVSGTLLYLPVGWYLWKTVKPLVPENSWRTGIALGLAIHALVIFIALHI